MKNRWIAALLLLAMALAALLPAAALAEPAVLTLTLGVKEKYQINVASIPGAEGKQLVFATSNKKVAVVSAEGVITAKKTGAARIAVGYGDTALAVCTVKVLKAPKKISFAEKSAIVSVGDFCQLSVKLPKKTASTIAYESSDTAVATVDANGKLTAVSGGKAVITARAFNGKTAKCAITVLAGKAPTKVTVNADTLSLQVKEKFALVPSVAEGEEAVYTYVTSNKKVATISAAGVVKARKKGTAQITVRTHNGVTATVKVVVKGKLKNLYGYLTNKPKTFVKNARKLKLKKDKTGDSASVMYYDSQAALIMTANSCQVSLNPTTKPKYCIEGIDCTLTAEQAAAKLVNSGWALADARTVDGIEVRAFARSGDANHIIAISADGSDIRSIDAVWKW